MSASVGTEHGASRGAEKTFCDIKYSVSLKLYKHDGWESSVKELDDESNNSGATTSEEEGDSKGKEPAPEPSGNSASATRKPALNFPADKEVYFWGETFPREFSDMSFWEKP